MPDEIDISEDYIAQLDAELLNVILKDHSTSKADVQHNIFWATADYQHLGKGYHWKDEIRAELITGNNSKVVTPRVMKSKTAQTARSKDMAEVFTPSWICNAQNNLIDEAWFGRKDVSTTKTLTIPGPTTPNASCFPKERHGRTTSATADWR